MQDECAVGVQGVQGECAEVRNGCAMGVQGVQGECAKEGAMGVQWVCKGCCIGVCKECRMSVQRCVQWVCKE